MIRTAFVPKLFQAALALAYLLAVPRLLGAQESGAAWSGGLTTGLGLELGETDRLELQVTPEVRMRAGRFTLDLQVGTTVNWAEETVHDVAGDGSAIERVDRTTVERYDVTPTLEWAITSGLALAVDYDWRRHTDHGVAHHHLVTVGLHGSLGNESHRAGARVGYMNETETDRDRVEVPVAALTFEEHHQWAAGGSLRAKLEGIFNLSEPADLRVRLDGQLAAPLFGSVELNLRLNGTYRNKPTEILIDPTRWSTVYEVDLWHVVVEPGVSWTF